MNRFEQELKNNNLVCSECLECKKIVWPPSDFCSSCFATTTWRQISRNARLIEYSFKNDECFCVAEFEGEIRLMGTIKNPDKPEIGNALSLEKCDFDGMEIFVFLLKDDNLGKN